MTVLKKGVRVHKCVHHNLKRSSHGGGNYGVAFKHCSFLQKMFKKRPRGRIMVNIKECNCGVAGFKFRIFSFQNH